MSNPFEVVPIAFEKLNSFGRRWAEHIEELVIFGEDKNHEWVVTGFGITVCCKCGNVRADWEKEKPFTTACTGVAKRE